ncbi:MAG: InlB B-repeat-containing protein [Bacilli bacterium]|nr:InlB B-repeat-containing protein [Bacilli bacterium]
MKLRFKMLFSLLVTIVVFASVFFTIKYNNNNVSVVKNEAMPFMGNNSVNYGGFTFTRVSDISGTTEANNAWSGYDSEQLNESVDFKTVLKVEINVTTTTSYLYYVDTSTVIAEIDGDIYSYQDYLLSYNYQSSVNGNSTGTGNDINEKLYDKVLYAGDKLTIYLMPSKDVDPGTTRLSFTFSDGENYEDAYTEFDMLRLTYVEPNNGHDYVRFVDSYMSSFTLDEISEVNNANFIGWGTEDSVEQNRVVYNNRQTFSGWNQISNIFTNNELYLLALFNNNNPVKYTVRYNKNGGTLISGASTIDDQEYYLTDTVTIAQNVFKKNYYEFSSWRLNTANQNSELDPGQNIKLYDIVGYANSDNIINIYAYWEPIEYTITYRANEADGELEDTYYTALNTFVLMKTISNLPDSLDDDLYREGYTFVGFSEDRNAQEGDNGIYASGSKVTPAQLGYKDVTLYAIWKSGSGGGTQPDDPDPDDPNPDDPVIPTYYTVSFDGNNGTGSMSNVQVASTAVYTIPACTFIRNGYTFAGWQNGSSVYEVGERVSVTDLNIVGGVITFAAQWSGNGYVLSFDPNGGNGTMGSINYQVDGEPITVPANSYTRRGYNFVGWATSKDGNPDDNYRVNSTVTLTKNVKLYAVWDPIEYYIIYEANGENTESGSNVSGNMERTTATYDQNVTLRKNAFVHVDSNYAFAGWSLTQNGQVAYVDQAVVSNLSDEEYDEIILYAIWVEKKPVTITFNTNGGTGEITTTEGETYTDINLPTTTPERDGYTFSGWATEENGPVVYKSGDTVVIRGENAQNIVLYAVWTPKSSGKPSVINGKGGTALNNPNTSRAYLAILLVILSCVGAGYVYSKRRSI